MIPSARPYRGLEPLEAEDAGIFFGRDGPTIVGLDLLRGLREAAPPRLLVILGASGCRQVVLLAGRASSAACPREPALSALAGDQARARRDQRRSRTDRQPGDSTEGGGTSPHPRRHPQSGRGRPRECRLAPSGPRQGEHRCARRRRHKAAQAPTLVLAIDQAEELFHAEGAEEARTFLDLLGKLAAEDNPALIVLFTIRSDSLRAAADRQEPCRASPAYA